MKYNIIEKKDNDLFVIYDTENKGMCCVSKYTIKQLLENKYSVGGVKFDGKKLIVIPVNKDGTTKNKDIRYDICETKRSFSTVAAGLSPTREEKKRLNEISLKRKTTQKNNALEKKEKERQEKIEQENKEKQLRDLNEKMKVLRKKKCKSKVVAYLERIEIRAAEYDERSRYIYRLEISSPAALTALSKLQDGLGKYCNGFSFDKKEASNCIKSGKTYYYSISTLTELEFFSEVQVFSDTDVSLTFFNDYEDYGFSADFKCCDNYKSVIYDKRGMRIKEDISDIEFGSTANTEYSIGWFENMLRKKLGRPEL